MRFVVAFALLCGWVTSAAAQDTLDPAVSADLTLSTLVGGFTAPTAAQFLPDGRLVVIEQFSGEIKIWNGNGLPRTIGDITVQTAGERGLLGMAVDPDFEQTRRLYLYYSLQGHQKVGWVELDADTDEIDGQPTIILENLGSNRNHNGGALAFGPNGNLYIGVGDTGCNCGCSPGTNSSNYFPTCLSNFQGKILRIDRDGNAPATNPLVNVNEVPQCASNDCRSGGNQFPTMSGPPAVEIYNWGFRNPWRFAFDEQTGYLWIGDVGEVTWEEISVSTGPGQHFGWPFREGAHGQAVSRCGEVTPTSGDCREPAFEYPRAENPVRTRASVTGGVFSNHCSWPEPWAGRYWFGDFVKSRVWTVTPNMARDGVDGERTVVVQGASGPVHFFSGPQGAIYYVGAGGGAIIRVAPANPLDCGMMKDAGVADTGTPDAVAEPEDAAQPDAIVVSDATTMPEDSGTPADAGTTTSAPTDTEDEACSCRSTEVDPNETPASAAWLALLMVAAMVLRRRA